MNESDSRLNRFLTSLCAFFILVDLLIIALGLASVPRYIERVSSSTIPRYQTEIGNVLTNQDAADRAAARGMTLPEFAWYSLIIYLASAILFFGVGVIVLWRARRHWFGWFSAHVMFFLVGGISLWPPTQVALLAPPAVVDLVSVLWPTVLLYLFLFPNGAVAPRGLRWPVIGYTIAHALLQLLGALNGGGILDPGRFESILAGFEFAILFVFLLALGSQVYRYRYVSSAVEKAQMRWLILATSVIAVAPLIGGLIGLDQVFNTFEWGTLSFMIVPVALGIAILRYRLWDIDLIIRRTFQYALLTAALAIVYFGGIIILQAVLEPVLGATDSPLITVMTTLAIAALFNPLRNRIREVIDRRFFRARYDAEKVLTGFSQTMRDEVDLDRLALALTEITRTTMQPQRTSLWIHTGPGKRTPGAGR